MSKKPETTKFDPAQVRYMERHAAKAATHRGITLSLKFKQIDIDAWKLAAEAADENLTDWVEKCLNKAAKKV